MGRRWDGDSFVLYRGMCKQVQVSDFILYPVVMAWTGNRGWNQ